MRALLGRQSRAPNMVCKNQQETNFTLSAPSLASTPKTIRALESPPLSTTHTQHVLVDLPFTCHFRRLVRWCNYLSLSLSIHGRAGFSYDSHAFRTHPTPSPMSTSAMLTPHRSRSTCTICRKRSQSRCSGVILCTTAFEV